MMSELNVSVWPHQRMPSADLSAAMDLLDEAWRRSRERFADIRRLLDEGPMPAAVRCVVVSGSLARMEYHDRSDLDLLVVIDEDQAEAGQILDSVWRLLCPLKFRQPKSDGIFSRCVVRANVLDESARGIINESLTTYGQRMQLLLDAQPVWGHHQFEQLQADILHWYREERVAGLFQEAGVFHWLWQDVQRYWRSIRSRACWLNSDSPKKSLEVNLKLRSSRLMIMYSFLASITDAHRNCRQPDDCIKHLSGQLRSTPLERVASALQAVHADPEPMLQAYERVWKYTADLGNHDASDSVPENILNELRVLAKHVTTMTANTHSSPTTDTDWLC
jgi:hypothetical protein